MAAAACINEWIDGRGDLASGTPLLRGVGVATFEVRGKTINALAQPYRFYLLNRMQDEYAGLTQKDQEAVAHLLSRCDMQAVLDIRLTREIGRENNLEVWL